MSVIIKFILLLIAYIFSIIFFMYFAAMASMVTNGILNM